MQHSWEKHLQPPKSLRVPAAAALAALLFVACFTPCYADDPKPDPAGIATGDRTTGVDGGGTSFVVSAPTDKSDPDLAKKQKDFEEFQAQSAKEPLAMKLADTVGHVRVATNFGWTLNTGYLVLFMQAGFALLTCGLVRKKNAAHLMMLNFAAYVFAFLAYYAIGFAFQFGAVAVNAAPANLGGTPTLNAFLLGGGSWGFLGGKGFFLSGPAYDAGVNCLMLFQVVFMETAGYIIVGATCERITFGAFLLAELFMGAILYPIFGCWVWGGGWLSQRGSTMNLGHGHVDLAGSTVVHGVGGFAAMALAVVLGPRLGKYGPDGRPRPFPAHNLAFVVIGTGIIVCFGVLFNERVVKIDDPCGAISVHGFCAWFGAVSVGIFADGNYGAGWNGVGAASYLGHAGQGVTGLLYGDIRQFLCQLMGATLSAVWAFGVTFVVFKAVNAVKSMRVAPEVELEGLDVPEFGLSGHPEDVMAVQS